MTVTPSPAPTPGRPLAGLLGLDEHRIQDLHERGVVASPLTDQKG